jgi:hypothetical protein
MLRNDLTPMQYIIRFLDGDIERTHYADDRQYYEDLIAHHGHLSDLRIKPLALTTEQQQRLDEIQGAGLDPHDASIYVRYGTAESEDSPYYDAEAFVVYRQAQAEPVIKAQRIAAEAEGVVVNGVRYAGNASNRQSLSEALQAATDASMTTFDVWKDSDGNYHANHPVADITAALRKIGRRRSALIALESQYIAEVAAGQADSADLDWSTPHD